MPDEGPSNWQQQLAAQAIPYTSAATDIMESTNEQYYPGQEYIEEGEAEQETAQPSYEKTSQGYTCIYGKCATNKNNISYPRICDLRKHQNNHFKKHHCNICQLEIWEGGAEKKDLNRHMWTHHPDTAREENIPKEDKACPYCGQTSRGDNMKRHMKTCKKKTTQ